MAGYDYKKYIGTVLNVTVVIARISIPILAHNQHRTIPNFDTNILKNTLKCVYIFNYILWSHFFGAHLIF